MSEVQGGESIVIHYVVSSEYGQKFTYAIRLLVFASRLCICVVCVPMAKWQYAYII